MSFLTIEFPVTVRDSDLTVETRLSNFIQWGLLESCSQRHSTDEALYLLDYAWKAQKLLWRLRETEDSASVL